MTVVTVNAVLGVVQESKAEKAIAALQEMTPATSRVLRGGAECTVPSRSLVPGDVVLLSAGDRIPADCRVLESIGLRVEESALPASPSRWKNPRLLCRIPGRSCRPPLAAIWYLWVPMWCTVGGVLW